MSNSSHIPLLDLEVHDIARTAWIEVLRHARTRSDEIITQRTNYEKITDKYHDDWLLLGRFEYDHFYSAWSGVAYRLRACAAHSEDFTTIFQRTRGVTQGEERYLEDDALFGFFVKGLSALESLYYSLYALGALIFTPTHGPSVPPTSQFSLLDPAHLLDPSQPDKLKKITATETHRSFKNIFPDLPITELLGRIQQDKMYKEWSDIRNIVAHRVATAGRTIELGAPNFFSNVPPRAVNPWGMDFPLDAITTASRYPWLKETVNTALEETAAFVLQKLPYTEDQLPRYT